MIKDKRFLTGLGSGLIIGAILLQLMNVASSGAQRMTASQSDDTVTEGEYTAEQLVEIADKLGYAVYEKSEKWYSQEKVDELVRTAEEKGKEAARIEQSRGTELPAKDELPAQESSTEVTSVSYRLTIESGMSSEKVAEALVSAKLIDETDAFLNELNRRKLTDKLQIGPFEFDHKPTLTELINMITNQ